MHGPVGTDAPRVETDEALVALWLQGRHPDRRRNDRASVARFLSFIGVPLGQVTADARRAFGESLDDLTPAPRARVQATAVSLLRLGRQVGYLRGGPRGPRSRSR
jgi:hypothetical protein